MFIRFSLTKVIGKWTRKQGPSVFNFASHFVIFFFNFPVNEKSYILFLEFMVLWYQMKWEMGLKLLNNVFTQHSPRSANDQILPSWLNDKKQMRSRGSWQMVLLFVSKMKWCAKKHSSGDLGYWKLTTKREYWWMCCCFGPFFVIVDWILIRT